MKNNYIFTDKNYYNLVLDNIKNEGLDNLHFLADFDNTLTKAFVNWKRTPSLVSVLRWKDWLLWEEVAKKDIELFEKYHPKEIDPNLSIEEKIKYMEFWWKESFELFIESWLTKNILEEIWRTDKVELREWVKEFLEFLNQNNIPIVIISASWIWKLSIKYFLEENNIYYPNIEIISNDFIWDKNWKAIDYKRPIIHSFNKSETIISDFSEIYLKIKNRKNVILLWDSLWDHHMVDWFNYKNLIKVWFLNYKVNELIEEYKKRYDILILNDWDFKFINNLLLTLKK